MKYIRTKDGIYELDRFGFRYPKDYKKADTIEELCDEYIVDETEYELGRNKPYLSQYNFNKWADEIDFAYECGVNLYLGIWVDSNLIKVAKMNNEGELELL